VAKTTESDEAASGTTESGSGSAQGGEAEAEEVRSRVVELRKERAELIDKLEELDEREETELDKLADIVEQRTSFREPREPRSRSRARGQRRPARRSRSRRSRRDFDEFDDDAPGARFADESSSLMRALTDSYLSGIRTWGQVIEDFADSVADRRDERERYRVADEELESYRSPRRSRSRSRSSRRRPGADLSDLPNDLYEGWLDTYDEAADVPRRVIDDFYDSYTRNRP
jgi:hypothetical protein